MFHSFGFTVTGLLPLLAGVRVVHHADPTDAAGLARKAAAYRPSILVGTPTFVGHLLDRARPGELDSLRLIVVGAEKCPPALFEKTRRVMPQAHLLEGYGVTECSPVVATNLPDANRPGSVGQPLPGVEVRVVDLETGEVLPPGKMGMLQVSGPGVFPGYLGAEASPFVEREGKRWYVTGDLAEVDPDGFIHFRGRLKRFLKAGGEMISLPALEEPFSRLYPPTEDGPRVAVEGAETEGGRKIVLFTTEPITLKDANALLQKEGFQGVMRLDEVRRLDKLPVLGTGKTDYRRLRAMLGEPAPVVVSSSPGGRQ
jgi:long-chain-fatty-acid--[acyl-carrier-protein] ligase